MKRGQPLKRKTALKSDPAAVREFVQRGRGALKRSATAPSDFRDNDGHPITIRPAPQPRPALSDTLRARATLKRKRKIAHYRGSRAKWNKRTRTSVCAMCGSPIGITGHHVIALEVLKREGVDATLWYDVRNHLPLCWEPSPERCHQRHELHVRRVPRDVVLAGAPHALVFANEVGLLHIFDREYPA